MSLSDAPVNMLSEWGVEVFFGLPGDGVNGFREALSHGRAGRAPASSDTQSRERPADQSPGA